MLVTMGVVAIAGMLVLLAIIVFKMDIKSIELKLKLAQLFEIAVKILSHQKHNRGSSR